MRDMWCNGTVSDIKRISPQDYFKFRDVENSSEKFIEDLDNLAASCTPEWINEYNKLLAAT